MGKAVCCTEAFTLGFAPIAPRDRFHAAQGAKLHQRVLRRGMDWKLFLSTFGAIFLAEMGDKTQLATLSLSANGASRWTVFAGSALALVATSAVAVLLGEAIARVIPPHWFKRAAGVMFLVLGTLFLIQSKQT